MSLAGRPGRRSYETARSRVAAALAGVVMLGVASCSASPAEPTATTPAASATRIQAGPLTGPSDSATATSAAAPTADVPGGPVVVLDPGHNGDNDANRSQISRPVPDGRGGTTPCNTTGTETDDGYAEHAFNWDVTQRAQRRLEDAGVRVVLTRPDDDGVGPCVDERGRAGEVAGADAVVSIHADGSAPGNSGFHVALSDPPLNDAQREPARALALAVRDAMRDAGFPDSDYIGADVISLRSSLAGLNHSTRPTVLVECANMRNPAEATLVSSETGRERYAAAIANGVLAFLR